MAEEKKKQKIILKKTVSRLLWRSSGTFFWLWIFDAFFLKLYEKELFHLNNEHLYFLLIVPVYSLIRFNIFEIFGYFTYLLIFPSVFIFVLTKHLINFVSLLKTVGKICFKLLQISTRTLGAVVFTLLFILIQYLIITTTDIRFQIPFSIASAVAMFLIILSVIKWVHDPFRPIRNIQNLIKSIGQRIGDFYYYKVIDPEIKSCNQKKIKAQYDALIMIRKGIVKVQNHYTKNTRYSIKRRVSSLSTIVFLFFLIVTAFGYSGTILSLNRLAATEQYPTLLSCSNGNQIENFLFMSLPHNASYVDCLFQSFSIMTTSQGFTLSNTSALGKLLIGCEIMTVLFLLTVIFSIFTTTIGLEDEIDIMTLLEITKSMLSKIDKWINECEISMRPRLSAPSSSP